MKNSNPTQCERIYDYIQKHGSITTFEAFIELGIVALGSRISEMRRAGIKIGDKNECVKNRYDEKCYVKRYYLVKEEQQ